MEVVEEEQVIRGRQELLALRLLSRDRRVLREEVVEEEQVIRGLRVPRELRQIPAQRGLLAPRGL